jgi:hypothetical protein
MGKIMDIIVKAGDAALDGLANQVAVPMAGIELITTGSISKDTADRAISGLTNVPLGGTSKK